MISFADLLANRDKGDKKEAASTVIVKSLCDWLEREEERGVLGVALHPSKLYFFCPREIIYRGLVPVKKKISAKLAAKFDIGHAMHWWYQNKYFGPMGVLKGCWRCCCGNEEFGFMPKNFCSNCKMKAWEFVEPSVSISEYFILGHADGILEKDGKRWVLDLKTIDPDMFKRLSEPLSSNVIQIRVYMWALNIDKGLLVYIDKSSNDDLPIKEFEVEQDKKTIEDVIEKANLIKKYIESKTLPARVCSNCEDKFAKMCPFIDICFLENSSIEKDWQEGRIECKREK